MGKGICLNLYQCISKKGFSFTLEREKKGIEAEMVKNSANFLSPKQMK